MLASLLFLPLALASSLDTVSVKLAGGGRFSCSAPGSADVSFQDIAVVGQDGEKQGYRRIAADTLSLAWAVGSSEVIEAPNFVACARLAGERGFEAFSAGEECTGYSLQRKFCRCSKGEVVLFVREDFIEGEDTVVPLADGADYPNVTVNIGQDVVSLMMSVAPAIDYSGNICDRMMQCSFLPPFDNYDVLEGTFSDASFLAESLIVTVQRGVSWLASLRAYMDVPSLRTASSCGLPLLQNVWPANEISQKYFLEECGQTISMPDTRILLVLSHKGFGSVYFPHDIDHDCTVNFNCTSCKMIAAPSDLMDESKSCGGYSFTLTSPNNKVDLCTSGLGYEEESPVENQITFKGSPTSERKILGFVFILYALS